MDYKVELAKNGENTLKVNGINIYSTYNPSNDAEKFILNEINLDAKGYLLIGLGLGYHLEAILKINPNKKIYILILDNIELEILKKFSFNPNLLESNNVMIFDGKSKDIFEIDYQIIIPNVWLKAINIKHPLFHFLEDIKIRQMSYNSTSSLLENNFIQNIRNDNYYLDVLKNQFIEKSSCLVASGPSLNETIDMLRLTKNKLFILCVGSSLKVLIENEIMPDAIIITDPLSNVVRQIDKIGFSGPLFYLSTANHEMSLLHDGIKIILFQEGYKPVIDILANTNGAMLETGGSVATTGISLIEFLGFKNLYLFGQDLGFHGERTHTTNSTSGIKVATKVNFRKILSNSGEFINTTSNLSTYHRWIEKKANETSMKIYNTARHGAKIKNVPFIEPSLLEKLIENIPETYFDYIIENILINNKDDFNGN